MSLRSSRLGFKSRPGRFIAPKKKQRSFSISAEYATRPLEMSGYGPQDQHIENESSASLRIRKVSFKTIAVRFEAEALIEPVTIFSMYTA